MTSIDREALDHEIRRNFANFQQQLPSLLERHRGKYCLMRHAQLVDIFDTAGDAHRAGAHLYEDGLFSIQEITDQPVDLGYFSRAVSCG